MEFIINYEDLHLTCRTCLKVSDETFLNPIFKEDILGAPNNLFISNKHVRDFLFDSQKVYLLKFV